MKKGEIEYRVELAEKSLNLIKSALPKNSEEFLELGLSKDGIYKRLEFAIQNILDSLNEIIIALNLGPSIGYKDIVETLHKEGIIKDALKEKLEFLIQLREVLIYDYDLISDDMAFRNMPEYLQFIEESIKFLNSFLEGEK
ncbi:hypothetical protein EP1X_08955 [Thermococcus sp. EP1]|uniref:type VII toxin-antitoxin system HepT family RNase toxin n=1 Tax=Thermococcus sp. EP1 TaxID=1591054 RepID=UPI0006DB53F6|nr:HepT-like ribonuclease domain-containing protein [Thermococcus sp. EP1]KPU62390.1 hypothetical protein EP1X_08955 [Thermococcus sp. EP1]